MKKYILMHNNIACGELSIDEITSKIEKYKDYNTGHSPYLGNADLVKMKKWWEMRAVPASRKMMRELVKANGYQNAEMYLEKNLALSVTDNYWIKPIDSDLEYDTVKFACLSAFNNGKIPYHNATSYDANASLGGQMEKYWDLNGTSPVLVKEAYKYYGQQAINEVFATKLHDRLEAGIPYVKYSAERTEDNGIICKCTAFTSENVELVPAYEVVESCKNDNSLSVYGNFIKICENHGLVADEIRDYLDYQSLTDVLINNTDRHLLNFGVLRNAKTMELISMAPLFDSGNSMYYSLPNNCKLNRVQLLEQKITNVYKSEEKLLKQIVNKNILNIEAVPSADFVKEFYTKAGVPEEKAINIAYNYETKKAFIREFQQGKTISLYTEKQKQKEQQQKSHNDGKKNKFIMICGIPGSGKTDKAYEIANEFQNNGYTIKRQGDLYPLAKCIDLNEPFIDEKRTLSEIEPIKTNEKTVYIISANEIRDEMNNNFGYIDESLVFVTAKAKIKEAIASDASVIFEATNLDQETRLTYIKIVDSTADVEKELHITKLESNRNDITKEAIDICKQRLLSGLKEIEPGWDSVKNIPKANVLQKETDIEIS